MRLVFFYTQHSPADKTQTIVWDPHTESKNFFAVEEGGLRSEGYFWLLKQLKEKGVFDEVQIIIESNRGPGSTHIEGIPCLVIPEISLVHQFLKPEDIIWVRGGFRTWFVHLEQIKKKGHWLLLYAANTGRERWSIWDLIFYDYIEQPKIDRIGRLWVKFHKPVSPKIFYPTDSKLIYDVCVGASHIHDRKGQWRTIEALAYYKHTTERNLKAIMPGRFVRGSHTTNIPKIVDSEGLDVTLTGMVTRPKLREVLNQSKIFVYLGEHGQNDRGPIEALCCGTPIIIANPRYHQSEVWDHQFCKIVKNTDYSSVVQAIEEYLKEPPNRKEVADYYEKVNGANTVVLKRMTKIFNLIKEIGKPDSFELYRRLCDCPIDQSESSVHTSMVSLETQAQLAN